MRESLTRWFPARLRARLELVFWLAVTVFVAYRLWPQAAAVLGVASSHQEAPDFRLTTLDGATISRESLRGKVVLVNVWATWCPPCRVEMPGFQKVYDRKRAAGFTIVGISTDTEGSEPVARYLSERAITYPVAMATNGVVQAFGGADALPTSFLLDRRGRIRYTVTGFFASPALEKAVDRLLAEPLER
ncbi:MAG: TlpA disulfide reductase family protein [Gemmatimonadaceae bacterium]|nr:TlpA disulfide reductase family protein [Gemmatimonadaceae bacterium]